MRVAELALSFLFTGPCIGRACSLGSPLLFLDGSGVAGGCGCSGLSVMLFGKALSGKSAAVGSSIGGNTVSTEGGGFS